MKNTLLESFKLYIQFKISQLLHVATKKICKNNIIHV